MCKSAAEWETGQVEGRCGGYGGRVCAGRFGKTKALAHRYAYIMEYLGVDPAGNLRRDGDAAGKPHIQQSAEPEWRVQAGCGLRPPAY